MSEDLFVYAGKHKMKVYVDAADFDLVRPYVWNILTVETINYAVNYGKRNGKNVSTLMHRIIMDAKKGELIDHVDRNGLNNRRGNLRKVTIQENARNKKPSIHGTGFKGVKREGKRFRAVYQEKGKFIHLGIFDTPQEAHETWKAYAKPIHGEFYRDSI